MAYTKKLLTAVTEAEFRDPLGREPGEPLFPERHDSIGLRKVEGNVGPREWGAQWQQTPRLVTGKIFSRSWFVDRIIEPGAVPSGLKPVRFWDWAYTEAQINKGSPDWSVGVKIAFRLSAHRKFFEVYILDMVRDRLAWHDTKDLVVVTAQADGQDVYIGGEGNGPQKGALDDIVVHPDLAGYTVWGVLPLKDKLARVQPFLDRCAARAVYLVRGHWNEAFFDEFEGFPNALKDDIIDATSGGYLACAIRESRWSPAVKQEQLLSRW